MLKEKKCLAMFLAAVSVSSMLSLPVGAAEEELFYMSSKLSFDGTGNDITATLDFDYDGYGHNLAGGVKSITAVYDSEGSLSNVSMGNLSQSSKTPSYDISLPADGDFSVKMFTWKLNNLTPICEEVSMTSDEFMKASSFGWDFEDGTDTDNNGALGKWTLAVKYEAKDISVYPTTINVADAVNQAQDASGWWFDNNYYWYGSNRPAEDSTKCMQIKVEDPARFTGAKVKLPKAMLKPGNIYKLAYYAKNSNSSRDMYVDLTPAGNPVFRDSANASWFENEWKDKVSPVGTTTNYWTKKEILLTPQESDFNAEGYTDLWVIYTRDCYDTAYSASVTMAGPTADTGVYRDIFYLDDISIELVDDKAHELSWSFESDNDTSEYSALGKWTYGVHLWDYKYYTVPQVINYGQVSDINEEFSKLEVARGNSALSGDGKTNDLSPTRGNNCIAVKDPYIFTSVDTSVNPRPWPKQMGMKVKVSKDQFELGKQYKLVYYGMTNQTSGIYCAIKPHTGSVYDNYKGDTVAPWVALGGAASTDGTHTAPNSYLYQHWTKNAWFFTPQETDFDKNGYADIWLIITEPNIHKETGKNNTMRPGMTAYFDDISIVQVQ